MKHCLVNKQIKYNVQENCVTFSFSISQQFTDVYYELMVSRRVLDGVVAASIWVNN
jgi:hypothetical protein